MLLSDPSNVLEIANALLDEYSRKIMLSLVDRSKSIEEISEEEGIPISTCYRRVHELLRDGIVKVCETIIQKDGKKYIKYRAAFRNVSVQIDSSKMAVDVVPNTGDGEKASCSSSSSPQRLVESRKETPQLRKHPPFSRELRLRNVLPVLRDCDLCSSQSVWCNTYSSGDSNTTIFVCTKCQFKRLKQANLV